MGKKQRDCIDCGAPVGILNREHCCRCMSKIRLSATQATCPRCGKTGLIRIDSGWCGTCSRPAPPKGPPRICRVCGELRRHSGLGMCSRCFQRDPDRPMVRAEHLIAELPDPPEWLQGFVVFLAARFSPSRATTMIAALGELLTDG